MLEWFTINRIKKLIERDYKNNVGYTITIFKKKTLKQETAIVKKLLTFIRKSGIAVSYFLHDVVGHELRIVYKRKEN